MGLGLETRHTADRPDVLAASTGPMPNEGLYEAGSGSFYLGFDPLI